MHTIDLTHFEASVLTNSAIHAVWDGWERLDLPDCWLVAGCLAQTVWNARFGFNAEYGVSDIDLVYFDPNDLSQQSEEEQAKRIRGLFPNLPTWIDVKNEARVHLWYEAKFGYSIAPYRSAMDAIDTFPTTATAIGMRPAGREAEICAPFGLDDLLAGIVRANKKQITREIYGAKSSKWLARWPDLAVISWDQS
ncbi:nucleotidyltransferase family protein [Rhizobium panacihumi]|uniref:nucleotidyltransferase family protein n=1 Tax=Rhizobium panacihumi TaxID=2008450 RepID=UPI003D7B9B6C